MGIFDRIAETLVDGLGRDPSSPATAKEEIELALGFADRGDLATAEERLREISQRFPRLALGFARLGEVRARRGALDQAAAAYGRAVDLDPDDGAAWFELGDLLARLGRFEPARDALRRALMLSIDPAERGRAHAALGRLYTQTGRLGKAARELGKAVELLPSDHSLAAAYGQVLVRAGDPQAAQWLTQAALAAGADPRLIVDAAAATEAGPAPASAEPLLRQALDRKPGQVAIRAALSGYLTRAGRTDEGLALAQEAVAAAPRDAAAVSALRESHAAAGRWSEALAAARREAELGAAPAFESLLALALGARDRAALAGLPMDGDGERDGEREPGLAADRAPRAALTAALRAFLANAAEETDLIALAAHAPDEASRRFIVEGLAPAAVPAGNLFALLDYAHRLAARTPELWALALPAARAAEAYDRPLLVAVMGEFNAGKSSFVNALCGEEIAPVGVTPTTATINILRHGEAGGRVIYHDGSARELDAAALAPFLRQLGAEDAGAIRLVEIFYPLAILRRVEIVDTPGLNSLRAEHESVARDFLVDADAIVWLFAVGQAAKATEQQALRLAQSAGKRVLGVLNKVDRASADEVAAVSRHVADTLGDLVEAIVPISARRGLAARKSGDPAAMAESGLHAIEEALERRFFQHARALKRTTALGALRRFVAEAKRVTAPPPAPAAAASPRDLTAERRALAASEERLRGAIAVERVALRARIDEAYRSAAFEVRELVRPRRWVFGEHRADPADEEFLIDLLDDALGRATATSRAALSAALVTPEAPPLPAALVELCERASERAFDRFAAYARGVIEAGTVPAFFRLDLPRIRLDLAAIRDALGRRAPDPEEALFRALDGEVTRIFRQAARDLRAAETTARIRALIRHERLVRPLDDLARNVEDLARVHDDAEQAGPRDR
jgi:Flp pilus assembly protein TadD/GTP-binding protein EngB required for normal cell division